jgi:MFS family permease
VLDLPLWRPRARDHAVRGPGRVYYGWVLVWALGITTTISYGTTWYLSGVLLLPINQDLGGDRATLSGAFSLSLLVSGVLGLPVGRLVDRHGARVPMAFGSLLTGVSLVALGRANAVWQVLALWTGLIGIGQALTLYGVCFTVVTNWFHRRRGSALAILTLVGGLASPVFVPSAGLLVSSFGWRAAVTILGLVQLTVALPIHAVLLRRHPEDLGLQPDGQLDSNQGPASAATGMPLIVAMTSRAFWTLTLSWTLGSMATTTLVAHQVAYMIGGGMNPALAASIAGVLGLVSLPARYLINRLSEKVAPHTLLAICTGAQASGTLLLAISVAPLPLGAYVLLYGGAFGTIAPLSALTMAEHFGRRAYGAITAVRGIAGSIGASAGPIIAGALFDHLRSYEPALFLTAGAFLLSAFAVWRTPTPVAIE